MPDFVYTARAATGQQSTGTLTAGSEREVMALLDQRGLFPVRIQPAKAAQGAIARASHRRIKSRYLAALYAQLADLLHAGVPLLRSLDILERQTHHPGLASILRDVRARVADGTSLADALAQHGHVFNELTVSMIRAGQEGGFLEDVLKRIADFTNNQEDLKSKVVGALAYPIFLSVIGSLIVFGLVIFLVPRFEEMFQRQQAVGELPTLTIMLLSVSRFLTGSLSNFLLDSGALWLALGLVGLWFLFRRWARSDQGRLRIDGWKLAIPG